MKTNNLLSSFSVLLAIAVFFPNTGTGADEPSSKIRPKARNLKPVKVYILAGQSNMVGHGIIKADSKRNGGKGSLEYIVNNPTTAKHFRHLMGKNKKWVVRDDVLIRYQNRFGPLTVGYGAKKDRIGPEFGFGLVMGDHLENQVLIIKTCWGGKSLIKDFRPPGAGGETGPYYTLMIKQVRETLDNLNKYCPGYNGQGYEIAGFGWHQGWNDGLNKKAVAEYEDNLAHLIKDLRKEFRVSNLPVVIAVSGFGGRKQKIDRRIGIVQAQFAVAKRPEFKNTVIAVETRDFFRPANESPSKQGYHWNTNAETYYLIGEAMGKAMCRLSLKKVQHIIDTHIHLYDPRRPDGIPWPPKDDKVLYKPHLPEDYKRVAKPAGVTGVIIAEASDRLEDNRWVLDLVKGDDFFVALVGNIDPYRKDFGKHLEKLRQDPRFVGIRARIQNKKINYRDPQVLANFRQLADANLTLDILMNGEGVETIQEIDRLAQAIPKLHIVVNHVLGYNIDGKRPDEKWIAAVMRLAKNDNVYVKVSGLYQRCTAQPASKDPDHYRSLLDILWQTFGRDRLIYGSNWPCTKKSGDYASFLTLVHTYFADKGQEACERYFWKNAARAYRLNVMAKVKDKSQPTSTPFNNVRLERTLKLLQHSADTYIKNRKCFTCHHQALPAMTIALARDRGFAVDDEAAKAQSGFTHRYFTDRRSNLRKGKGVPGGAYTAGYALVSLHADGWKADKTTTDMVEYLFRKQRKDGCWPINTHRPPLEDSHFTATALTIRGVQLYASDAQKTEAKDRIDKAGDWLRKAKPKTNEDWTFYLFALKWSGAETCEIQSCVEKILGQQNKDGGWSQLPKMNSDAYATGQILVALHQAGGLKISDKAYQRGVKYLQDSQLEDGSWLVKTRSRPFQTYFESGFPHEKSQWISICATSWATMALVLTQEPTVQTPKVISSAEKSVDNP